MPKDTKHLPDDVRANFSSRILLGRIPEDQANSVLELLGEADPNGSATGEAHPELEADETPLVSSSWANTHR